VFGCDRGKRRADSDANTFRPLLLLSWVRATARRAVRAIWAMDASFGLRQVFHQRFVGVLERRVGIDAFHIPSRILCWRSSSTHFVENDRAFEPVAGHGLNVFNTSGSL